MGDLKATKAGLHTWIKSLAGIPHRSLLRNAWGLSTDEFWTYQTDAFRSIYNFATQRVRYYRERQHLYPPFLQGEQDLLGFLRTLPILGKSVVKERTQEFWPDPRLAFTTYHTTSGTSGTPLRIAGTLWERSMTQALMEEWFHRSSGFRRPRALYLSGFMTPSMTDSKVYWVDRLSGDIYLSIYNLSADKIPEVLRVIQTHRPQLIYGYASAVYQLALLLDGRASESSASRIAVVTSEVLQPDWRSAIEATLVRRVFDLYGSQEGSHVVLQCAEGNMHIHPLFGVVEIVDEQGLPVSEGEVGRVLVTGLGRKSMPLVRYELGDAAVSTNYATNCPCGLRWPTIGPVTGRSEDLVRTRDGRQIGYLTFHATKNLRGIKEAQLVQTGYEQFTFRIVKSDNEVVENAYIEAGIQSQIELRLQTRVSIAFQYLPAIPRGPNGKFKAVVVDFAKS